MAGTTQSKPDYEIDLAPAGQTYRDTDKVIVLLTDAAGDFTKQTVLTDLSDLRKQLAPADLFGTAPPGATPGVRNQRYHHLRNPVNGQPTRADLYVFGVAWGAPQVVGYVLDATAPSPSPAVVLTLSAASATPGQAITLTATPSGASQPFSKIDFFADGATTPFSTATAAPWQASYSSQALGAHTLVAVVTDSLNATATSLPKTLTVAAAALPVPMLTFAAVGNKTVGDPAVTLTVTSTNAGAGAPPITIATSNGAAVALSASGGVYTATFPAAGASLLTASQAAGNGYAAGSASQTVTVSAGSTPAQRPTASLEISPDRIASGGSTTMFVDTSSPNSTVTSVVLYDDGALITTLTTPPAPGQLWQYTYFPTEGGERNLTAVAMDALGVASLPSNVQKLTVAFNTAISATLPVGSPTQAEGIVFVAATSQVFSFDRVLNTAGNTISLQITDGSDGSVNPVDFPDDYVGKRYAFQRSNGFLFFGTFPPATGTLNFTA